MHNKLNDNILPVFFVQQQGYQDHITSYPYVIDNLIVNLVETSQVVDLSSTASHNREVSAWAAPF